MIAWIMSRGIANGESRTVGRKHSQKARSGNLRLMLTTTCLLLSCLAGGCTSPSEVTGDARLTAQMTDPHTQELNLEQLFQLPSIEFLCVLDEHSSASTVLRNLRATGRISDVAMQGDEGERVPEGTFGLLAVSSRDAYLALLSRAEVRFGLHTPRCFGEEARLHRDLSGVWTISGTSFVI